MTNLQSHQEIHIVGIGGAGMSAIARILHARGFTVHGSDLRDSPLAATLREEGVSVAIGHAAENIGAADLVLASSAIPDDNVELVAAREAGAPVKRRPEFLGDLTADYKVIAVAGAHGKTTVTGMVTLLLIDAGLDPTYIVGGVLENLGTNAGAGEGDYFVIEADEYRNTFLALSPSIAVVTNVEFDHPDCFPSLRFVRLAFGDFVDNIVEDGVLIACNDDEVAHAIGASFHANGGRLRLYGRREGQGLAWQAVNIHPNLRGGVSFTALYNDAPVGELHLKLPGAHNAVNALAALSVATELGIEWTPAKISLERFTGTARRFEVLGEAGDVIVIDDYAHHPTQIRAVLAAARHRYPERRIVAAWEPHTFSRIQALKEDFMAAFDDADRVVVLPIYAAREIDDGTMTSASIAAEIAHAEVQAADTLDGAVELLVAGAEKGDLILLMGAGDETIVGQRVLERLRG
ncbi:MAG: UDP-N-acetylmuramate--L-alanine ligase [Anaerolineales bacterium]